MRWGVGVALAATVAMGGAACSGGDDETLEPLPVEGSTVVGSALQSSATRTGPDGPTTPGGLPAPTADPSVASSTASAAPAPTADWDGARFDVGTIDGVTTVGAYTAIELDRWSYTSPDGETVDAGGLTAEPIVAWWRTSPFSNVRVQPRTFVLAPDVEVLTLDPAARDQACADPSQSPPTPAWETAGTSALGTATADGVMAILSYSAAGLVTRIRLTQGC